MDPNELISLAQNCKDVPTDEGIHSDGSEDIIYGTPGTAKSNKRKKIAHPYTQSWCLIERRLKKNKKAVFSSSGLGGRSKDEIRVVSKALNIEYSDEVRDDTTHLVVRVDDKKRAFRTLKYLEALANRIYVVSMDYVRACMKRGRLVDETEYIPLDSTGYPGPICAMMTVRPFMQKLRNFDFYVVDFEKGKICSTDEFKELIKKTGAQVHTSISELTKVKSAKRCKMVLAEKLPNKTIINLCKENHIMIIDMRWFLELLGCQTSRSVLNAVFYLPNDIKYRNGLNEHFSELIVSEDDEEDTD